MYTLCFAHHPHHCNIILVSDFFVDLVNLQVLVPRRHPKRWSRQKIEHKLAEQIKHRRGAYTKICFNQTLYNHT